MDKYRRHRLVWRILVPLIRLYGRLRYNFHWQVSEVEGPFLLVSNHNTDLDPVLIAASFPKQQMYYIASEHLLRSGFGGRLVNFLQEPIARQKGGNANAPVMAALRHLKSGHNVGFFPEGNRSWDGVTGSFPESTGKFVRTAAAAGATLVTYRFEGGYFASPRWAGASARRGRIDGGAVGIYKPEELKAMKAEEINALISRDISVDDYALQQEKQIPFKGRRLAEHLERLLYRCPLCLKADTLRSEDDTLRCSCGAVVRYLPTGFLSGDGPFSTLREALNWQNEQLRKSCDSATEEQPIFSDSAMLCHEVQTGTGLTLLGQGSMSLFRDRLCLPGITLPLSEIRGISIRGSQNIYFGTDKNTYQISSDAVRNTLRYLKAIEFLTGKEFGV